MKNRLLIVGKTPPPIGGVTIHVSRLIGVLQRENIEFQYLELAVANLLGILVGFIKFKKIHLHTSNVSLQLILAVWARLFNKTLIITYHGDLKRYNKIKTLIAYSSIRLCTIPIILNYSSFNIAKTLNKRSLLVSSFIPPVEDTALDSSTHFQIEQAKQQYKKVFCTSATGITYDINGDEIYGVFELIEFFSQISDYCLVVCDSSSQYKDYILANKLNIPCNVIFISKPHSMFEVLKLCDGFIRNTSTDGDSVAIKESLFLNKLTIATDIVDRPKGAYLYKREDLSSIVDIFEKKPLGGDVVDGSLKLIDIYKK